MDSDARLGQIGNQRSRGELSQGQVFPCITATPRFPFCPEGSQAPTLASQYDRSGAPPTLKNSSPYPRCFRLLAKIRHSLAGRDGGEAAKVSSARASSRRSCSETWVRVTSSARSKRARKRDADLGSPENRAPQARPQEKARPSFRR